ncbi:MAG: hypothetical protein K2J74_02320 [Muribaculaceae bacterium]|nr:hypothetical protein [Muribaculaceae bacterium]
MGISLVSCSEDKDSPIPPYVNVLDGDSECTSIAATSAEYKTTLGFESNTNWSISKGENSDWLTISPMKGEGNREVDVTIAENTTVSDRETSFTVKIGAVDVTTIKVVQSAGDVVFVATIVGDSVVSSKGGKVQMAVNTNLEDTEWSYAVTPELENEKADKNIIFTVPENTSVDEVEYNVVFKYRDDSVKVAFKQEGNEPFQSGIVADLLDVVFNEDGTAKDVSPYGNTVNCVNTKGTVTTEYVEKLGRRVAKFTNAAYSTTNSGFYAVEYDKGGDFINKIADGCTFETIFKINREHVAKNGELKWFSTHEAGGIGFLLTNSADQSIAFIVNASTTGASNWCWARSGRTPLVNQYYHVVGVYNKLLGQVEEYINGEFYSKGSAYGEYRPVSNNAEFIAIGGDAVAGSKAARQVQGAINGEVAMARIYSEPLTAEDVAKLWKATEFAPDENVLDIAAVDYIPACQVKAGYKYHIYGKGFVAGDKIEFKSNAKTMLLNTETSSSKAVVTIPSDMITGTYNMTVVRGDKTLTLGSVEVSITDSPRIVAPKIIAHRGIHNTGETENSLGSLREALKFNAYGSELDVHITKDGVVVVHHDGVVSGLAGGKAFQNCNYDEIKDYKLSNGEKLPVLSDMLKLVNEYKGSSQTKLIIEFKTGAEGMNAVDPVVKMVKEAGLEDRVEYISFGYDICKYVATKAPNTVVGYLYGNTAPATVKGDGINSIDYAYNIFHSNPSWITDAQKLGMIVNVWTVNTNYEMLYFIGKGVDYITTDYPQTLKELNAKTYVSAGN